MFQAQATQTQSGRLFLLWGLGMRLVMIDNYDSFTYNLVQLFYEFDLEVVVRRHDEVDLAGIEALRPDWLCISPGPKAPAAAGISKAVIAHFYKDIPILGVCLGMQAINEVFGGRTVLAPVPVHGKRHEIFHTGEAVFAGLPSPFGAARYHSLMVSPACQRPGGYGPERRRGHHGAEPPALPPARGAVSSGVLSDGIRPGTGGQFPRSWRRGLQLQGKGSREQGKAEDWAAMGSIATLKTKNLYFPETGNRKQGYVGPHH